MFGYPHTRLRDGTWSSNALSYPHYGTVCVDFGRIIQVNATEEHFMAKIYSRLGCSGAPAFDLNGSLLGILHGYSLDVTTFFSPTYILQALKANDKLNNEGNYVNPAFQTWCSQSCGSSDDNISVNIPLNGNDSDFSRVSDGNDDSELDIKNLLMACSSTCILVLLYNNTPSLYQ